MTVFELSEEALHLKELIENVEPIINEETGEVLSDESDVIEALEIELNGHIEDKLENIGWLIKESEHLQKARKEEAKRLNELAKSEDKKQDRLKYLANFLLKGNKKETKSFKFSYRKSTSVDIVDEAKIPPEFIKVKEVFSFDKKAIMEKLKDFEEVEGAELEVKNNLQIK
jgi:hypothetical protein